MKIPHLLGICSLGAAALLTAGCGTTDTLASRISKNHELYEGLTVEEKKQIQDGVITVGFSPDMVMMALGKPERIVPGRGPGEEDWVYVNLYSRDGRSIAPASKMTMSFDPVGSSPLKPIKFYEPQAMKITPVYQVAPDLANHDIKAEAAIKVHVKFSEGTVADIQIVNDNNG